MLMRTTVCCAAAAWTSTAHAQQALFSNASPNPGTPALALSPTTASGITVPGGGLWSEVQSLSTLEANAQAGIACQSDSAGGVRAADNFIVPAGEAWSLSRLHLYVYEAGAVGLTPPVSSATLRIWYATPGAGGQVVWGDTITNRFSSATPTSIFRVFNTEVGPTTTPPDTGRRVFEVILDTPTTLGPGEYWLDWQLTPANPKAWLFAVPATLPDARSAPGWNARQLVDAVWQPVLDAGKPAAAPDVTLDVAFILDGSVGTACDSIDFNGDTILPDTQDITDFLTVFAGGTCPTGTCSDIDFNNDGLLPDTQDIASFLSVFSGGPCI